MIYLFTFGEKLATTFFGSPFLLHLNHPIERHLVSPDSSSNSISFFFRFRHKMDLVWLIALAEITFDSNFSTFDSTALTFDVNFLTFDSTAVTSNVEKGNSLFMRYAKKVVKSSKKSL